MSVPADDVEGLEPGSDDPAKAAPPGWRRTLGRGVLRVLMLLSLTMSLSAVVFWWRSAETSDRLQWVDEAGGATQIISIADRLIVARYAPHPSIRRAATPVSYQLNPVGGQVTDGWEQSIWKTLGVEWRVETFDPDWPGGGWWLRVKWLTLAFLFALPVVLWKSLDLHRKSRAEQAAAGYCPDCGRPRDLCTCTA